MVRFDILAEGNGMVHFVKLVGILRPADDGTLTLTLVPFMDNALEYSDSRLGIFGERNR